MVLMAALIGWILQQEVACVDDGRCWLGSGQGASGGSEGGCVGISGS